MHFLEKTTIAEKIFHAFFYISTKQKP